MAYINRRWWPAPYVTNINKQTTSFGTSCLQYSNNIMRELALPRLHRQIYIVIASALGLFVTSTFILSTYIPSPADLHNHDDRPAFHSVEHVVGHQLPGLRFEEPKGHLRWTNYVRTPDSSKSADENDDREEAEEEDDGENNSNDDKNETNDEEEVHNYNQNDDANREGNSDSESGDAELQEDGSSSDKDNNEKLEVSPLQRREIVKQNFDSPWSDQDEGQAEKEHLPQTIDAKTDEEKDPPQIFHILETRFMQNQPDLVQLAKARLQLFEAICLPTVVQQTAWGNFLWIIRTDPDLHMDIRRELVEILTKRGALTTTKENSIGEAGEQALTYVIGSNDNYIVANSTTVNPQIQPFDVRDMFSNMLSKPDKIFAGNVEHIKSTLDGLSSKAKDVVLWTRLDADDGLSVDFLKYIQDQMIRYFVPHKAKDVKLAGKDEKRGDGDEEEKADFRLSDSEDEAEKADFRPSDSEDEEDETSNEENSDESKKVKSSPYSPPNWMYWCGGQNIDWFLTDPIHDPKHETGVVYPVLHENVCVTPGITVSIRGDIEPALVPKLDHDTIVSYLDEVGGEACNRTGVQDDDEVPDDGSCFQMIHGWTHAVRSRTPTSAGMMGVHPDDNQLKMVQRKKGMKKILWREMHKHFLLKDDDLRKTNTYFAQHVYDIAEENARGQCTNGHSCKVRVFLC